MADVIDMASSRSRLAELREKRALRRAQQTAIAALAAADLIRFAKGGEPKVEKARWPGGIDDLEF